FSFPLSSTASIHSAETRINFRRTEWSSDLNAVKKLRSPRSIGLDLLRFMRDKAAAVHLFRNLTAEVRSPDLAYTANEQSSQMTSNVAQRGSSRDSCRAANSIRACMSSKVSEIWFSSFSLTAPSV